MKLHRLARRCVCDFTRQLTPQGQLAECRRISLSSALSVLEAELGRADTVRLMAALATEVLGSPPLPLGQRLREFKSTKRRRRV